MDIIIIIKMIMIMIMIMTMIIYNNKRSVFHYNQLNEGIIFTHIVSYMLYPVSPGASLSRRKLLVLVRSP